MIKDLSPLEKSALDVLNDGAPTSQAVVVADIYQDVEGVGDNGDYITLRSSEALRVRSNAKSPVRVIEVPQAHIVTASLDEYTVLATRNLYDCTEYGILHEPGEVSLAHFSRSRPEEGLEEFLRRRGSSYLRIALGALQRTSSSIKSSSEIVTAAFNPHARLSLIDSYDGQIPGGIILTNQGGVVLRGDRLGVYTPLKKFRW